jgi:hypothetical protein
MTDTRHILRLNIRHYEALLGLENVCLSADTRGTLSQWLAEARGNLARLEADDRTRKVNVLDKVNVLEM